MCRRRGLSNSMFAGLNLLVEVPDGEVLYPAPPVRAELRYAQQLPRVRIVAVVHPIHVSTVTPCAGRSSTTLRLPAAISPSSRSRAWRRAAGPNSEVEVLYWHCE